MKYVFNLSSLSDNTTMVLVSDYQYFKVTGKPSRNKLGLELPGFIERITGSSFISAESLEVTQNALKQLNLVQDGEFDAYWQ